MPTEKELGSRMLGNLVPLFQSEEDKKLLQEKLGGNEAALVELGKSVLRQDDYSRKMSEAQAERERAQAHMKSLEKWQQDEIARLAKLEAEIKANAASADGDGKVTPAAPASAPVDTSRFLTRDQQEQSLSAQREFSLAAASYIPKLAVQHFKEFGEVLDTEALLKFCKTINRPMDQGGYELFVKDKVDAKAQAAREAELKAAEERGFRRAMQESSGSPSYVSGGGEDGAMLGNLGKTTKPGDAVAAAVATYHTQKKLGVGGA